MKKRALKIVGIVVLLLVVALVVVVANLGKVIKAAIDPEPKNSLLESETRSGPSAGRTAWLLVYERGLSL